jgi:predicted ATPase
LGRSTAKRTAKGFFLRAESAQGVFEFMSDFGVAGYGDKHLGRMSHGEGFLQVASNQLVAPGLYLMDEPEAALSFSSCLQLMRVMTDVVGAGGQIICATHSPLLCALPGAEIIELSANGIARQAWEDLDIVVNWRSFMYKPQRWVGDLGATADDKD